MMMTIAPERLALTDGDRLLDVGCGRGRHLHGAHLYADVRSVGLDLDRSRLAEARDGFAVVPPEASDAAEFVVGDAGTLPFPADTFDAIVCAEVLEHLPAYEAAIDELARVLRPGGQLGISVPRFWPERLCWWLSAEYHAVDGGHVRIFRRSTLEAALTARGLYARGVAYAHALHSPLWWLKCLWWDREPAPRPLSAYEAFLDRVVTERTPIVDRIERVLDPLLGKSLVLYREAR